MLKASQCSLDGNAACKKGRSGKPKQVWCFHFMPARLSALDYISTCQPGKHHDNAADGHPQGEFMRMNFISLFDHCFHRFVLISLLLLNSVLTIPAKSLSFRMRQTKELAKSFFNSLFWFLALTSQQSKQHNRQVDVAAKHYSPCGCRVHLLV